MRSAFRSVEWLVGLSAILFFVFGNYVAPYYESLFVQFDSEAEGFAMSCIAKWISGGLVSFLILKMIWRLKTR